MFCSEQTPAPAKSRSPVDHLFSKIFVVISAAVLMSVLKFLSKAEVQF